MNDFQTLGDVFKRLTPLGCAVCLYLPDSPSDAGSDAVTVIDGYAVCTKHAGLFATTARFSTVLEAARR